MIEMEQPEPRAAPDGIAEDHEPARLQGENAVKAEEDRRDGWRCPSPTDLLFALAIIVYLVISFALDGAQTLPNR